MAISPKMILTKLIPRAKNIYADRAKVDDLLKKAEGKSKKKGLAGVYEDVKTMMQLLKDYRKGNYRNVNTSSILLIIAGLIYLVTPIDVVPDFLLGMGFLDDAVVLGYVIKQVYQVIDEYTIWKLTGKKELE